MVSELTRDAVELHGLSLRVVDRQTSAWVCIDVRTVISTNGVVYNLPNAHISLASVEFRAVPDSRTMRAASLTRTHFFQKVNDIELILPIWRRGRLKTPWHTFNGRAGRRWPTCFDLLNDDLGNLAQQASDRLKGLPLASPPLTLPWLRGRTLHLSIYNEVIQDVPSSMNVHLRRFKYPIF